MTAPLPGELWRLTTTVTVEDAGRLPAGFLAFRVAGNRHFVFPQRAGMWRPTETPTAEDVLEERIHAWDRAAANSPRDTREQSVARSIAVELASIRELITHGTVR